MTQRAIRSLFSILLAVVLAVGTMASSVQIAVSHNPAVLLAAEAERHAVLQQELADHGHSHDDGWDGERLPGHSHGHNTADHSHDTPSLSPRVASVVQLVSSVTWIVVPEAPLPGRTYPFERPPKLLIAA